MPSNTFEGLRSEIKAALSVVEPKIRGLEDLRAASLSDSTKAAVESDFQIRKRRRARLDGVISALDRLADALADLMKDGYPDEPISTVDDAVFSELQEQFNDFKAAFAVFASQSPQAVKGIITFGSPIPKP